MVFTLENLFAKYGVQVRGVIEIGAHHGQEYEEFVRLGVGRFVFFEPLPSAFAVLEQRLGARAGVTLANVAVGARNDRVTMFVDTVNLGMSSSILPPKLHLEQYPTIDFPERADVPLVRLDDWLSSNGVDAADYNLLFIDAQGYEREALRGAPATLRTIDAIYTEVERVELYEGSVQIADLDVFLREHGFERVETEWYGGTWGDAFYLNRARSNLRAP